MCYFYIFYVKPTFSTCGFDAKVLLARDLSALNDGDGDSFRETQVPGARGALVMPRASGRGVWNF